MKKVTLYSIILTLLYACNGENTDFNNTDLLFPKSIRLKVPSYQYSDSSVNIYDVRGDTSYSSEIPDTLNQAPSLKWDSLGPEVLTVAIFSSRPIRTGESISNKNDIVWQWHTGMSSFKPGNLMNYYEGKNVSNGIIEYDQAPDALETGMYYWAVWGWNAEGTRIEFSSRILSFYVP